MWDAAEGGGAMRKEKMCVCKSDLNQEDGGIEMATVSIFKQVNCSCSKCRFVPARLYGRCIF